MHPPADSQVSRVPTQRTPSGEAGAEQPVAPPPAPPARRRFPWRRILVIVAAATALFCLAGAAIAYTLYDRFTAPDRSAPDVVVNNYLQAFMVDKNDVLAGQMTCEGSAAGLAPLSALRDDLAAREQRFQVTFIVKWGPLDVRSTDEDVAEVFVDLVISYRVESISNTDRQRWRFVTRQGDGWRVCEAARAT